jgi:hypothetical protein
MSEEIFLMFLMTLFLNDLIFNDQNSDLICVPIFPIQFLEPIQCSAVYVEGI